MKYNLQDAIAHLFNRVAHEAMKWIDRPALSLLRNRGKSKDPTSDVNQPTEWAGMPGGIAPVAG